MNLGQVNIYRILHIENIPHILDNGVTHKDSKNANPDFIGIGDIGLINTRSSKQVTVDNGDKSNTIETITLGHFIPFYFGVKMPMLYVIQQGGNFVPKPNKPENIVYLVCSLQSIANSDLNFYFSDGHATDGFTTFYNSDKISDLPQIIDWKAVKTPYWGGQENLKTKRKKQAEFLVGGDISSQFIVGFGCYNETSKQKLINFGIDKTPIKVIPNAYF
ncbi:MAG: DUF4433 domain-containing protein [Ekhidna sp.]|nr:DUF4433 domain-containing protein [Ekhidna sp.]MBC6425763.1 DUF4433 domain-containing protein [Ekhidna sp.]